MRGDDALSSTAALIFRQFVAKSADNFAMKRRSGGRQFKSILLHTSVSGVSDISENRSKSARARAICDHPRTRRISPSTRMPESGETYPGAICLGPRIIAVNSPADRTRRTGSVKVDRNSRGGRRQWRISSRSRSFPGRRESPPADSYADRSVCCCRRPACYRHRKPREPGSDRGPSCRPDIRRRS